MMLQNQGWMRKATREPKAGIKQGNTVRPRVIAAWLRKTANPSACKYIRTTPNSLQKIRDTGLGAKMNPTRRVAARLCKPAPGPDDRSENKRSYPPQRLRILPEAGLRNPLRLHLTQVEWTKPSHSKPGVGGMPGLLF